MNANKNVEVVAKYFESLRTGNLGALDELFSDTIIWNQPGNGQLSKTYKGKKEVFALFGKFMEISKGSFKINKVHNIMANGNFVTTTLEFSAEKSGSKIAMPGVDLMRIEDGRITEVFLFSSDQAAEDAFWVE